MLSILATILSWDDPERERAGLRRIDKGTVSKKVDKGKGRSQGERSAEDAAALNEVSHSRPLVHLKSPVQVYVAPKGSRADDAAL